MSYCVAGLSLNPKYSPAFTAINEDGSKFFFKADDRRLGQGLDGGFPLTEETAPKASEVFHLAKLEGRSKSLSDIFWLHGAPCISQRVRDIIEAHEPGVHQFFPLTLLRTKNEKFEGNYYLLNICNLLNSIIIEKSSIHLQKSIFKDRTISYYTRAAGSVFNALNKEIIRKTQLWRENLTRLREFFISNDIYNDFIKHDIKGIDKHNYVKNVEE